MTKKELQEMKHLDEELRKWGIDVNVDWEEEFSIHNFLREFQKKVDPDKENEKYVSLCNETLVKYIKLVSLNIKNEWMNYKTN